MLLLVRDRLCVSLAMRRQVAAVARLHLPQMFAAPTDLFAPIAMTIEVPNPMSVWVDRPDKGVATNEHDICGVCAHDEGIGWRGHVFDHWRLFDDNRLRLNDNLRRSDDHCRRADDDLWSANENLSLGRQCNACHSGRNQGTA